MKKRFYFTLLLSALALCSSSFEAYSAPSAKTKKEQSKDDDKEKKEEKKKDKYAEAIEDATLREGLFRTWLTKKNELYFELVPSNFDKLYLLANRVIKSNSPSFLPGDMISDPLMFSLQGDTMNVAIMEEDNYYRMEEGDPIASAFEKIKIKSVHKSFPVVAHKGDTLLIDVTSFFATDEKMVTPLAYSFNTGGKMMGSFESEMSKITEVKSFEKNTEISSILHYSQESGPFSFEMRRSILALPEEPMMQRYQDNRVGYFNSSYHKFDSSKDGVEQKDFIHRWNLQPKPEDVEKYFAGEKVEPQEPIVFYVDSAFPAKWRESVKAGIEDWNIAFEAAGFKNAIIAKDYPTDGEFDPEDIRYNCIRYVATDTANAAGPSYVDPRSGEILVADVRWYHNVISLVHSWRIAQTAAVDPRVRTKVFSNEVMNESLRYVSAHEIGHTLGLMHNMGASYAYPVDSLRSATFTQKYGTTPSIMDYARNNFVAQPGDYEKGVRLVPPLMGVYDIHAIEWGYRLFKDTKKPEDEYAQLNKMIEAKADDPMFTFGAQQLSFTEDPTDQTEDLSNDHLRSSDYAISNLRIIVANIEKWYGEEGRTYKNIDDVYRACFAQYNRHIMHVLPYLGGVEYNELIQNGSSKWARGYISKTQQKAAMEWLVDQALDCRWMTDQELFRKLGLNSNGLDNLQFGVVGKILNAVTIGSIYEGERSGQEDIYTVEEYLDDAVETIFRTTIARDKLSIEDMNIQNAAITGLEKLAGLVKKEGTAISLKDVQGMTDPEEAYQAMVKSLDDLQKLSWSCSHLDKHSSCSTDCHHDHLTSFARYGWQAPKLSSAISYPLATNSLRKVLKLYKSRKRSSDSKTKAFYEFQIARLESKL